MLNYIRQVETYVLSCIQDTGVTTGLYPKCTFKSRQPKGCTGTGTDGRSVGPAAPAAGLGLVIVIYRYSAMTIVNR